MLNFIQNIDVTEGNTVRMDCPECRGRKTFTVSNIHGQLLWNCYKASCSISGTNKVGMSTQSVYKKLNSMDTINVNTFYMPEYIIPLEEASYKAVEWAEGWGLDANKYCLMYDIKEHRVVFLVKYEGEVVDATGRAVGKRIPKWKRYCNSGLPYTYGSGKVAIVVEDCVSAAIVGGDRHTGIAIMVTSMSNEQKQYLAQFSTAVIALDPDAVRKSLAILKELRSVVKNVTALKLHDDLKYRNKEDMDAILSI